MFLNKYLFFISVTIVVLLLSFVYSLVGCYYYDYDSFISYVTYDMAINNSKLPLVSDANFLFFDLIILLQRKFTMLNIYGLFKISSLGIFFVVLNSILIKKLGLLKGVLLFIVFFLFSLKVVLFIHTNILVVLLGVSSFLFILFFSKEKYSLLIFVFLSLFTILTRVDLSVLIYLLFFLSSILFCSRKIIFAQFIALSFSVLFFIFFVFLVTTNYQGLKEFFKYERSLQDRMDFVLDTNKDINSFNKEEMIFYGMGRFLHDEDVQSVYSYDQIIKHKTTYEYVFNNVNLWNIYVIKLERLMHEVLQSFPIYLLLCIVCLIVWICYSVLHKIIFKVIFIVICFLSIPFLINILATVSTHFLLAYLLAPIIFSAVFLLNKIAYQPVKIYTLMLFLLFFASVDFKYFSYPLYKDFTQIEEEKEKLFSSFRLEIQEGFKPIISYIEFEYFIPSSLKFKYKNTTFIFLDAGAYNNVEHFSRIKKEYFKELNSSFIDRLKYVKYQNRNIYSSENMFNFIIRYVEVVHNTSISYEIVEAFEELDFNKYKITGITKIN